MPTNTFDIEVFREGLITSVDQQDIPASAASYSENIDGDAVEGRLQGIPGSTVKSSTGSIENMGKNAFLRRDDGKYDLIYNNGTTDIRVLSDFYGTPADSQVINSIVGTSMIAHNKAVHIGTGSDSSHPPKWVGRLNWLQFAGRDFVPKFTGSGLNDMNIDNTYFPYNGVARTIRIEVYTPGTPDLVTWSDGLGNSGSFLMSTSYTLIIDDVYVRWAATTGHTLADYWEIVCLAKDSLYSGNAELSSNDDYTGATAGTFKVAVSGTGVGTTIPANILRRYKTSIVYEGFQESMLSDDYVDHNSASSYDYVNVILYANKSAQYIESFDRRITSVNIYCAVSTDTSENNLGLYRLLTNVVVADNHLWTLSGVDKYQGYHDTNLLGVTYESNSGIPENADTTIVNYELSAEVSGFLFAGKCYTPYLPDANRMIFRSRPLSYDSFDIVNDKLILPILPTAMAGFAGKLYVWDLNTTIIINPQGLFIEDIIHGKGCTSHTSWTVIDIDGFHAILFCDYNDCYITNGAGIKEISNAIRKRQDTTNGVSWQSMDHANYDPIVVFDSPRNTVLFITSKLVSGATSDVFAYHITKGRWDYYPNFTNSALTKGAISGKSGETYCSNGTALLNNFGDTTANRAWVWISQQLTFNSPKQNKHFTHLYLQTSSTGTITPLFSTNGSVPSTALSSTTRIGSNFTYAMTLRIKLSGTAALNYVTSLSILWRQLIGNR